MSSPPAAPPAAAAGAGSPDSAAAQSPLPTSSPAPLPPLRPIVAQSHSPPSSAPTAALPTPGPSPQTGLDNAEEPAPALSFANGGTVRSYNPNGLANGNGGAQKNVRKSCEAGLQVRRGSVRASGSWGDWRASRRAADSPKPLSHLYALSCRLCCTARRRCRRAEPTDQPACHHSVPVLALQHSYPRSRVPSLTPSLFRLQLATTTTSAK